MSQDQLCGAVERAAAAASAAVRNMVRGPELAWIKKKVCDGLGAWPRAFDALGGDERQLFLDLLDNANNGGQVNPSVVVYTSSMEPDECREMYGPLTGDAVLAYWLGDREKSEESRSKAKEALRDRRYD